MTAILALVLLGAPQDEKIQELIRELGAQSIDAREQAEADLKKLGKKILPELRKAFDASPDAEVRTRLEAVIKYWTQVRWHTDVTEALKIAAHREKPVLVFSTIGPLDGYV